MIAQEHGPLTVIRDRWGLFEDVDDGKAIFHLQRHEHSRHEREVKIHVRFVAVTEIGDGIFRPLVRLRQKHATTELGINVCPQFFQIDVRLRKILAVRPFALVEVGNGIEPKAVDAKLEPEIADPLDHFVHRGVIEIQIGLMRIEAMPVI